VRSSAPPNAKLTRERRKHNHTDSEITPPKEKRLITPEQSESGAAYVQRLSRPYRRVASNGCQKLDLQLRTDRMSIGTQGG